MVTRQVRVCDRCDAPGAVTVIVLIDGMPRKEDLCPNCRAPIENLWERMPRPTQRKSARRLAVVTMDEVARARKGTHTSRKAGFAPGAPGWKPEEAEPGWHPPGKP